MIERSSLGTPAARALRARADAETAKAIAGQPAARQRESLTETSLAPTWHEQLAHWLTDAVEAGVVAPNAMVLATADAEGMPSSRTVLCKGLDERGVVFFTSYSSSKSHDLMSTRFASVTFPWWDLQRQVHINGTVEKVSAEETERYWNSRPRSSQLSSWASPQSSVVASHASLDYALAAIKRQFAEVDMIPVPPHWGGWRVRPEVVEFWQARRDRMHDRLRYVLVQGTWQVERLAP
ncbi:pyridoxamine 5'-phosphate oxidase [Amycolatopsis thailandensis]|uniref:pyridoxamine 5'-phosphate oxidase n=1 Tax=Amycolatopsis thailandensis TaxID=589330 RepID=UPI003658CBA0